MTTLQLRAMASALVVLLAPGCKHCRSAEEHEEHEDEEEQLEERENSLANFWRVRIAIVGAGRVATVIEGLDCASDGTNQRGDCGPRLFKFDERKPPLLRATGVHGWRFDHWESQTRARDGALSRRAGPMPDGRVYLNGFGYEDTGAVETVYALFEPVLAGPDDLEEDAAR